MPTSAPIQALRVCVAASATARAGTAIAGQIHWAREEQQPRHGCREHEHDQPRIGHVVGQRSHRPTAEVVEPEHGVLDNAEQGAGGTERDHDVQRGHRAIAARQPHHHRDHQEQHELLRVHDAGARIERHDGAGERERRVAGERPEERRHLDPLPVGDRQPEPEQRRDAEERFRGEQVEQRQSEADRQNRERRALHPCLRGHGAVSSSRSAAARTAEAGTRVRQR